MVTRYNTEILADSMTMLGSRPASEDEPKDDSQADEPKDESQADDPKDDLPF